ncbi:MAG: heparan-alpha-glucosaminide N-acetyltransferase domain-containing protein [Anaerolineales bacterium]
MDNVQTLESKSSPSSRLFAVDALRGLIIILMALDHANFFVAHKHSPGEYWGSGFPIYYDSLTFMTRFVTHLAAPGFFFLMGVGMLLFAESQQKHGWSKWAVIRHFLIRGVVLIALQQLVVNRAWELASDGWPTIYIGVLVALGATMIIGSLLLWLKPIYLLILAVVLFVGTEFLVPAPELWGANQLATVSDYLNTILLVPSGNATLWSNYPILPWLELVVFGILFGGWLKRDQNQAYSGAIKIGLGFLLAFLVVRYLDGFGNILPRMGNTWIDYLNLVKYPPSITFTLLTMGLNLVLLGVLAKANEKIQTFFYPLVVFGKAPLFFYVIHLFLYAGLGMWLAPEGTSIAGMYPYWLLGLLLLFPVCLLYGRLKHHPPVNKVLRYL